jgi:hypothetical protein
MIWHVMSGYVMLGQAVSDDMRLFQDMPCYVRLSLVWSG